MIVDENGKLVWSATDNQHNRRILEIIKLNPGARKDSFRQCVEEALIPSMKKMWGDNPNNLKVLHGDCVQHLNIRPDAFLIDNDQQIVTCWEVEHHHRYRPGKYYDVFWLLDEFYWNLRIVRLDAITGGAIEVSAVDEAIREGIRAQAEREEPCGEDA